MAPSLENRAGEAEAPYSYDESIERLEVERSSDGRNFRFLGAVVVHLAAAYQYDDAEPGVSYVIYEYADPEQPMICVSFSVKSDGLALVNAGFLKTSDEWRAQLFSDGGANRPSGSSPVSIS